MEYLVVIPGHVLTFLQKLFTVTFLHEERDN